MLWECSTPFVFMRWGLHALGRADSKLYLYNGLTMMAVFFLCRNVMGVGEHHPLAGLPVPCVISDLIQAHCCSSNPGQESPAYTLYPAFGGWNLGICLVVKTAQF